MTENAPAAGAFWRFSLDFYADERVQKACLSIQDQCGADVNVALYLLFRAREGERLDAAAFAAVDATIRDWRREVVEPLRAIRRRMKSVPYGVDAGGQSRLRALVKKAELDAEKLEQFRLERLSPEAGSKTNAQAAAQDNLAAYAEQLGTTFPADALAVLVGRLGEIPSRPQVY